QVFPPCSKHQQRLSLGMHDLMMIKQQLSQLFAQPSTTRLACNDYIQSFVMQKFFKPYEMCTFPCPINSFKSDKFSVLQDNYSRLKLFIKFPDRKIFYKAVIHTEKQICKSIQPAIFYLQEISPPLIVM